MDKYDLILEHNTVERKIKSLQEYRDDLRKVIKYNPSIDHNSLVSMPVDEDKLNFKGEMFGVRIIEDIESYGENNKQAILYIEDDGTWYPVDIFASFWLKDLLKVMIDVDEEIG